MKPANLTRISTHSASHFVRGLGIWSIPDSSLYSTNLSYVTPGLLSSSSNVNDCFPPTPRFLDCSKAAATSGEDSFNRIFFNLTNSFSIASLLSSNILNRSSSIKLHSLPMGVNQRASALCGFVKLIGTPIWTLTFCTVRVNLSSLNRQSTSRGNYLLFPKLTASSLTLLPRRLCQRLNLDQPLLVSRCVPLICPEKKRLAIFFVCKSLVH